MAPPDREEDTDPEVPRPHRRRHFPTLSDIDLGTPSFPPPPHPSSCPPDATEAERQWHALQALDHTVRALAASYQSDRFVQRLRAWAILVAAVTGGIAGIIAALK